MSSNPLIMGYGGGDPLRTGTVWPAVGSLPRPVCAGCGQWPMWPAAPGPWRERIIGGTAGPPAWPPAYGVHDHALYKSTAFTFFTFVLPLGVITCKYRFTALLCWRIRNNMCCLCAGCRGVPCSPKCKYGCKQSQYGCNIYSYCKERPGNVPVVVPV